MHLFDMTATTANATHRGNDVTYACFATVPDDKIGNRNLAGVVASSAFHLQRGPA